MTTKPIYTALIVDGEEEIFQCVYSQTEYQWYAHGCGTVGVGDTAFEAAKDCRSMYYEGR
jgi:hypothetical protein